VSGRSGKEKGDPPDGYSSCVPWTKSNMHPVVIRIERHCAWLAVGRDPGDDAEGEPKRGADPMVTGNRSDHEGQFQNSRI